LSFCLLLGLLSLALGGLGAFLLTDGGVRREIKLLLARRIGGVFRPRFIAIGDSLAAGCPWSKLYKSPFAALNLAEGGATLKQIAGQAYRIQNFVDAHLLIDGGLNDLLFDHVTLEQFEADCQALVRRLGAHEQIIFTLMPYTANPANSDTIDAANKIIARICETHDFGVLDLNKQISQSGVRKPQMTNDGLHLTHAAEMAWLAEVKQMLVAASMR